MGAGGHTENTDGSGADNVIRFPRDWFGSKDDLVPFGPAADRLEAAAAAQRELQRENDLADALTANDFWGEGAGALHQPVGVPDVEERGAPELEPPTLRAVETAAAPSALVSPALRAVGAAPPRRSVRADRTLTASWRRSPTLPSGGWLSGVAVAVMLICAVGIFLLGRTHSAPTAAHGGVVHAPAGVAPGIDLSRQVDFLAARGMRDAARAVAVVERLRQPAPRRRAKAKHRAETAKHAQPAQRATVTTASVSPAQPVSESSPTPVSDSSDADAVTAEPSAVTHSSSAKSSSAKTDSSSTDSSPPASKSQKQSSTSSASSSLAPGPSTAGTSGPNCNPQCK